MERLFAGIVIRCCYAGYKNDWWSACV